MSKFTDRRKLRQRLPPKIVTYPAVLGNGAGIVVVPDRANYVYARVGNSVEQVYNSRVPAVNDLLVVVGRDEQDPQALGTFQVLSFRTTAPGGSTPAGAAAAGYAPAKRYQYNAAGGGQDPLWVEQRQIMPLGTFPSSGLTVQIQPGFVLASGDMVYVPYQTVNLSAYQPAGAGDAVLVLVYFDATGAAQTEPGAEYDITTVDTIAEALAYQPAIPAAAVYLSALVRLYYGQTVVQEGRTNTDIYDLRSAAFNANPMSGDYLRKDGSVIADFLDFDTDFAGTANVEGRLSWNSTDGTLQVGLPGGNVINQIGQEIQVPRRVKNDTGSPSITNGKLLYVSGGDGNNLTVKLADNTTGATADGTLCMATETFTNLGYATTFGLVRDVNTAAFAPGTQLYLGTNGDYTATEPVAPAHAVKIGSVFRQSATEGAILVNIDTGAELRYLHDVLIDITPADNELLAYDTASSLWKNQTAAEAGVLTPAAADLLYLKLDASNDPITGTLTIQPTADVQNLIVKQRSGGTANLTEWQDSSSTVLASVSATGTIKSSGRRRAVATKTGDYTLTVNDEFVVYTGTGGHTITLPVATGSGQEYRIANESATDGAVLTLDGATTDTIKRELTQVLYPGEDLIITDYASGKWA